ncbi:hypothetical protein FZEAL_86 [Fusarium zealandicum]|uniref:Haloacid dehalogenase n=1 Tax=Fusarium zealandicum TaxID=1053134 RepID=A0A8H4XQ46_9HYPO|nr:hypothetical protein FZEAL_86 [Fusarium zealandicum]
MQRRNLLLCFDAFGTLFRPIRPVAQQYAEVARQCGFGSFSDHELQSSFRSAIKQEGKKNPNYGKSTGLGATKWWTNVIHNTFTPFLKDSQPLPRDLAPRLLHRFASKDGYDTEPNLVSTLQSLGRHKSQMGFENVIVGVITNSDDRVPGILSSFGLNVSPLRSSTGIDPRTVPNQDYDIDFHCMSYDAGVEKPDELIFHAAEFMLTQVLAVRGKGVGEIIGSTGSWHKVYVGDDFAKDVLGAKKAGWDPVLLDAEDQFTDLPRLKDSPSMTLDSLYEEHAAVRVRSIADLVTWLTAGTRR